MSFFIYIISISVYYTSLFVGDVNSWLMVSTKTTKIEPPRNIMIPQYIKVRIMTQNYCILILRYPLQVWKGLPGKFRLTAGGDRLTGACHTLDNPQRTQIWGRVFPGDSGVHQTDPPGTWTRQVHRPVCAVTPRRAEWTGSQTGSDEDVSTLGAWWADEEGDGAADLWESSRVCKMYNDLISLLSTLV